MFLRAVKALPCRSFFEPKGIKEIKLFPFNLTPLYTSVLVGLYPELEILKLSIQSSLNSFVYSTILKSICLTCVIKYIV